jgi:hypothetical protein
MIRTFNLISCKRLESIPNPTPLPSAQLCCTWAFTHVREYVQVVRSLILNTHVTPSDETMKVFHLFHPPVEVDFPLFVNDFHHETKVFLDQEALVSTFVRSPHLLSQP